MLDTLRRLPIIAQYRKHKYDRRFLANRHDNLFRGLYPSFEEAARHLPHTAPAGYDNSASAGMYKQWLQGIRPQDYPVLFWLSQIPEPLDRVIDFGGHIGFLYYSFRQFLHAAPSFQWRVMDVPAVIAEGRALAKQRNAQELAFSDSRDPLPAADVLLASGSLQYVEPALHTLLDQAESPPRHLLINMTPMHDEKEFFTVNSIGTAYCPYAIRHREQFAEALQARGWQQVAEWSNPEKSCSIPFHESLGKIIYRGGYWIRNL